MPPGWIDACFAAAWHAIRFVCFAIHGRYGLVSSPEEEFVTTAPRKALMAKVAPEVRTTLLRRGGAWAAGGFLRNLGIAS